MFDSKLRQHHLSLPPYHRRLLCEALEARTLLSVSLPQAAVGDAVQAGSAAQQQTLADLPAAAQHSISSAIGQDQSAYHATSAATGVTLANPANGFTARVQSGALQVSTGSDTWDMSLVGLSYGGGVQALGTAKTSTNGNRVDCNYGTVDEWYVNGPSGLEQGFTVASPQPEASGSLTVELALGGDLVGTVNAVGDGLTLTRPDGSAALGYTGLAACDARGTTLPASLEVRVEGAHSELLIHVNDAGAQGPITIDPFVQEAKLTASNYKGSSSFGWSVSIDGNTVVVGAYGATVGGNAYQGVAYVFTKPTYGWADMTQTAELTASDGAAGDYFGQSVSISGNTVVVGAWATTVGGNYLQGAAYVFTEPVSGWADMTQTAKLTASDGAADEGFGDSVSISGNTVVATGGGAAYVFTQPISGWMDMTQTAKLTASDGTSIGFSVSINGSTVVVAAFQGGSGPGAAYVFTKPASGWADMTQTAELIASDGAAGGGFGYSVSISGNTVVVGAVEHGIGGPGAAYVFTEPASGWVDMTQTAKLTASDGAAGDALGWSVCISGSTVFVGAAKATVGGNSNQGAVYMFTEPASGWADMTQTAKLTTSDGKAGDNFGYSVFISGNTVVVGAVGAMVGGNSQGAAYVFATPPTPLTVTPADWTSAGLTLKLGSDGDLHVYTTGTTTDVVPPVAPASVSSIEITSPSDTTANLTINSTAGDPIPAGGLDYSGAGGLIITGSGTVALSGTNTYTGGTTVSSGRLLIKAASALPGGTSLTVDAGGTFLFDPSPSAASSVKGATTAAPVTTNVVSLVRASSATAVPNVVKPSTSDQNWRSSIVPPAAFQLPQSVPSWAWLAAIENSWNATGQNKTADSTVAALDKVLARFGV